jgi:ketosteroid isomerase-like protein
VLGPLRSAPLLPRHPNHHGRSVRIRTRDAGVRAAEPLCICSSTILHTVAPAPLSARLRDHCLVIQQDIEVAIALATFRRSARVRLELDRVVSRSVVERGRRALTLPRGTGRVTARDRTAALLRVHSRCRLYTAAVLRRAPDVERVISDWLEAKHVGDAPRIRTSLSSDDAALAIGTGAEEWYAGATTFADAHASAPPFTAAIEHLEAYAVGPVGWAAVRAVVQTGDGGGVPVRLTLVLANEDGSWRIVQSHASTAASDYRRLERSVGSAARLGAPRTTAFASRRRAIQRFPWRPRARPSKVVPAAVKASCRSSVALAGRQVAAAPVAGSPWRKAHRAPLSIPLRSTRCG